MNANDNDLLLCVTALVPVSVVVFAFVPVLVVLPFVAPVTALLAAFAVAVETVFILDVTAPEALEDTTFVCVPVVVAVRVFATVLVVPLVTAFANDVVPADAKLLVAVVAAPSGSISVGLIVFIVVAVPAAMLACEGVAYSSTAICSKLK